MFRLFSECLRFNGFLEGALARNRKHYFGLELNEV